MNPGEVLALRGVHKTYRVGAHVVQALQGVDLQLHAGEMLALTGPSGSGKSTLLNILGGLDVPSSGELRFGEHRLDGAGEAALTRYRREHVGFVFQFYNLIPSLTAQENVAIVTEIAPSPMPLADALALVGLKERLDHFPAQLSGGEQQRVAIARALASSPRMILADEPTGNLDTTTGQQILGLFDDLHERGATIIMVAAWGWASANILAWLSSAMALAIRLCILSPSTTSIWKRTTTGNG